MFSRIPSSLFLVLLGVLGVLAPGLSVRAASSSRSGGEQAPAATAAASPATASPAAASASAAQGGATADRASAPGSATQEAQRALLSACERRLARTISAYFSVDVANELAAAQSRAAGAAATAGAAPGPTERGEPRPHAPELEDAARTLSRRSSPRFLVATVPDPIDSGQYNLTDQIIEALQQGVEASGRWTRDRFWLPWKDVRPSASGEPPSAQCRSFTPGIVLFRGTGPPAGPKPAPVLLLLIVGETPTWGVQKSALADALDLLAMTPALQPPGDDPTAPVSIDVLGPIFSGSARSIRATLERWDARRDAPNVCFTFVSAGATATSNKTLLDTCGPAKDAGRPGAVDASADCTQTCAPGAGVSPKLEFHATVIPDAVASTQFFRYLLDADSGLRCRDIALLKETGTIYGAAAPAPASAPDMTSCDETQLVTLHFPLHISAVRRAYEQAVQQGETVPGETPAPIGAGPQSLEPTLDEPADPIDIPPSLSPRTPFTNDLVLSNLFAELERRHVRYIGLWATDPTDVVFLGQQLRARLPDARLFTFQAQMLYAHPKFTSALHSMLLVSPYPLFLQSQSWIRPGSSRDIETVESFPNDTSEAEFNAVRALLNRDPLPNGGAAPKPLLDYIRTRAKGAAGDVTRIREPSLWISAVGRGGLLPVARLGNFDDLVVPQGDYMLDADTPGTTAADVIFTPRPSLPSAWWVLVGGALALVGAHLLAQYSALGGRPSALPRFFFSFREPAHEGGARNVASHHAHAAASSFVLVAATIPIVFVTLLPHLTSPVNECPHGAIDLGAAVVLGAGAVALLVAAFVHLWIAAMRRDSAAPVLRHVLAPIVVPAVWLLLVVGATIDIGAANIGLDGPAWRAILCARVGAIGSGLSPLTPALFFTAALYVWHLGQIQRIRELSSMGDLRVYDVFAKAGVAHADIAVLEQRLYEVLGSTLPPPLRIPLLLLFVGVAALQVLLPPLSTLEPSSWTNRFFLVAITVIFLGAWLMLGTLSGVWRRLARLLWRLAHDPMVDAYRRLPNSYVRLLENQLSGDVPDARDLHVALRELELLDNNRGATPGALGAAGPPCSSSELEPIGKLWEQFFAERRRGADAGAVPFPVGESQAAEGLVSRAAALRCELEARYASRSLAEVSDSMKEGEASAVTSATSPDVASKSTLGLTNPRLKPASELWLRMAEELVACVVTLLVYPLVRHFRNLLSVATGVALLLMMGVASYAFQPRRAFMFGVGAVIVGVAVTAVTILVGLDRNELLSRIGKTQPGRVTFDRRFLVGVLSWGLLPVLSLLAVQYPEVVARVLSFLQPMAAQGH